MNEDDQNLCCVPPNLSGETIVSVFLANTYGYDVGVKTKCGTWYFDIPPFIVIVVMEEPL